MADKEPTTLVESQTQTDDDTTNIPTTFLRRPQNEEILASDELLARNLQIQENMAFMPQPLPSIGKLDITICQATLTKAHSPLGLPFIRMDPYVKIYIGGYLYETATDYNGSTNPAWNQTLFCYLPQKFNSMNIEIYDERSFSQDEKISGTTINIPETFYDPNTGGIIDDWFNLSSSTNEPAGRIRIILNFIPSAILNAPPGPKRPATLLAPVSAPDSISTISTIPTTDTRAASQQARPLQIPQVSQIVQIDELPATHLSVEQIESEVGKMKEMFPDVETQVIQTLFEVNSYDTERTADALLSLSADTTTASP